MDYYAIGQRIRAQRKARGLSQEFLAEKAGISVTHMSHIETGNTKLSLPVLVDIAETLEVRTDDLLFDEPRCERSAAIEAIVASLGACTTGQIRIIGDIVAAAKASLIRNA